MDTHDHHHHHHHQHHHHHDGEPGRERGGSASRTQLKFAIALTTVVFVVELVGGFWTNSLALLSDAAHVFMDVFALGLSLAALYLATFPASDTRTYGLHRTEVFAAAFNGLTLFAIAVGIFYEAWERLHNPPEIKAATMMLIALGGLIANAVVVFKLRGHSHQDLNVHSAFLHVVGDMLASVGVVVGGLVMLLTGWYVVDVLVSAVIGSLILFGSARLVRDSFHILLEGVPKGIDVNRVADALRGIDGVRDLHHLHIWNICSNILALSAHVLIEPHWQGSHEALRDRINHVLADRFGITDTTLQFDMTPDANDTLVHNLQHPEEPEIE